MYVHTSPAYRNVCMMNVCLYIEYHQYTDNINITDEDLFINK